MDVNKAGVVSYHQLFNLVYNEEAAAQVRTTVLQGLSYWSGQTIIIALTFYPR